MTTNYVDALNECSVKAAEAGFHGMFSSHITSPLALGLLAAPSLYHMATGREANENAKDVAEVGGLGMLVHGELPAFVHALGRR
jgi:hypothetical protein